MNTVGAYEAKTHLPKLLERVREGERIIITKHGLPIAVLQPFEPEKNIDIKSIIRELRDFRDNTNINSSVPLIRKMIEEGRR